MQRAHLFPKSNRKSYSRTLQTLTSSVFLMPQHVRLLLKLGAAVFTLVLGRLVDQLVPLEVGMVCVSMTTDFAHVRLFSGVRPTVRAYLLLAFSLASKRNICIVILRVD